MQVPTARILEAKAPVNCDWASVCLSCAVEAQGTAHCDKDRKVTVSEALPESHQNESTVEIKIIVPLGGGGRKGQNPRE